MKRLRPSGNRSLRTRMGIGVAGLMVASLLMFAWYLAASSDSVPASNGEPANVGIRRAADTNVVELGDATLESLLEELQRLDEKPDAGAEAAICLKLQALMNLHPEDCLVLGKVLTRAATESRSMRVLTDALTRVGHAEAQQALQTAMRGRVDDEPALAALIAALSTVEAPTAESEEALRDLAARSPHATIRAGAELGLGTMGRQMASSEPRRAARILRDATVSLDSAKTPDDRCHYLSVLGNIGAKESLPTIGRHLADMAPEVRAAAVAALRWIEGSAADDLLCGALKADIDIIVRMEVITVFGYRKMTPKAFAAHKQAYLKDSSTTVRLSALANLVRVRDAYPESRDLLAKALADACPDIREEATILRAID